MALTSASAQGVPRVVGGEPVPDGVYPDAVALFSGLEPLCTGTLIAPDLVLSAEHCFGISGAKVGVTDTNDGELVEVVARYDHPDATSTFDITVFELAEPVDVVAHPPRPLVLDCLAGLYVDGADVTVAGFGYRDGSGPAQDLLIAADITIGDADCSDLSRGCREAVSPGGELIAGGEGLDSCIGDSGGPLYLDPTPETPGGELLAGVVSRAAFPASQICGDGGIYVRSDAIAPWIEQVTGTELPRPDDCESVNLPPAPSVEPEQPLEVTQGRSVAFRIDAGDPDADDLHTWAVITGPTEGRLENDPDLPDDPGAFLFTADPFQIGVTPLSFEVTDDGEPARTSPIDVDIHVLPAGVLDDPIDAQPAAGCGCASPVRPAPLGMLSTFFLVFCSRRRKRSDVR